MCNIFHPDRPEVAAPGQDNGEKVVMASADGLGNPVFDGCFDCMTACLGLYPGVEWASVCQKCPVFKLKQSSLFLTL